MIATLSPRQARPGWAGRGGLLTHPANISKQKRFLTTALLPIAAAARKPAAGEAFADSQAASLLLASEGYASATAPCFTHMLWGLLNSQTVPWGHIQGIVHGCCCLVTRSSCRPVCCPAWVAPPAYPCLIYLQSVCVLALMNTHSCTLCRAYWLDLHSNQQAAQSGPICSTVGPDATWGKLKHYFNCIATLYERRGARLRCNATQQPRSAQRRQSQSRNRGKPKSRPVSTAEALLPRQQLRVCCCAPPLRDLLNLLFVEDFLYSLPASTPGLAANRAVQ